MGTFNSSFHETRITLRATHKMPRYIKYISRLLGLFLTLNVFVLTVHADDMDDCDYDFDISLTQTVIHVHHKEIKDLEHAPVQTHVSQDHKHPKKYQSVKHISFKVVVPVALKLQHPVVPDQAVRKPVIPKNYEYLFCREINPPPPKQFVA